MIIDAGFFRQWSDKGHVYGQCMTKSDTDLAYVNIPKNASSWTKPNLLDWGWEYYNYHEDQIDKTFIVVLRDPVERWISGIAEYLTLYHPNFKLHEFEALDLIFERVSFDDHTDRQVNFIHGLDTDSCIFLWCDQRYRHNFSALLEEHRMMNQYYKYDYQHISENNEHRKKFKGIFTREILNPRYMQLVQQYFEPDYQLINSVNFYGSR